MTDYKSGSRKLSYHAEILDGDVSKGTLYIKDCTVGMDATQEVKGTSSFVAEDSSLMDWTKNRIKIWLNDDGIETSLGVFVPQYSEKDDSGKFPLYKVEGYDLSILAQSDCILSRLSLKKGDLYIPAIQSLLISSGITNIISEESTAVFQSDRDDWEIGTSKLKIINQLLSEISFRSLEIGKNGTARLKRYAAPSAAFIDHIYREGQASIIDPDTTLQSNINEIHNIWIAVVSNPDLPAPLIAKYTDDNPMSKTSTVYTGQNKVKLLSFDNIASQADLQTAVNKAAFEEMQGIETVGFKTAIVADHEVGDTVAIEIPSFNGILEETQWNIDFSNMSMSHTGKRVINDG